MLKMSARRCLVIIKYNDKDISTDLQQYFFYLCVGVMGSICIALIAVLGTITYMTFKYQHLTFQINNIVAVVAAIGTAFVSSFFIIPKIITKYLFNRK